MCDFQICKSSNDHIIERLAHRRERRPSPDKTNSYPVTKNKKSLSTPSNRSKYTCVTKLHDSPRKRSEESISPKIELQRKSYGPSIDCSIKKEETKRGRQKSTKSQDKHHSSGECNKPPKMKTHMKKKLLNIISLNSSNLDENSSLTSRKFSAASGKILLDNSRVYEEVYLHTSSATCNTLYTDEDYILDHHPKLRGYPAYKMVTATDEGDYSVKSRYSDGAISTKKLSKDMKYSEAIDQYVSTSGLYCESLTNHELPKEGQGNLARSSAVSSNKDPPSSDDEYQSLPHSKCIDSSQNTERIDDDVVNYKGLIKKIKEAGRSKLLDVTDDEYISWLKTHNVYDVLSNGFGKCIRSGSQKSATYSTHSSTSKKSMKTNGDQQTNSYSVDGCRYISPSEEFEHDGNVAIYEHRALFNGVNYLYRVYSSKRVIKRVGTFEKLFQCLFFVLFYILYIYIEKTVE